MAHEVQAGSVRMKVREPVVVWLLGVFTLGIYSTFWWFRTSGDLARFDVAHNRGREALNYRIDQIVIVVLAVCMYGALLYGFVSGMSDAASQSTGATAPGTQPAPADSGGGGSMLASAVMNLMVWGGAILLYVRMWLATRRTLTTAGLLPEERGSAVLYVLASLFGGYITSGAYVQHLLNTAWGNYPRYFASLGGTREQIAADVAAPTAVTTPTAQSVPARAAALSPTTASPTGQVTGIPMPTGAPMPPAAQTAGVAVPPPQHQQTQFTPAAQRMVELEPLVSTGTMSPMQAYEYAQASEQVHGPEAAAPWYAFVLQVDPGSVLAAYWYGVFQLGRGDEAGIATLHRAMGDVRTDAHARSQVVAFLTARGRHEEAARYQPGAAAA